MFTASHRNIKFCKNRRRIRQARIQAWVQRCPPPPINEREREREREREKGEGRKYGFFLLSFFAVSPHTECCPDPAGDLNGPQTPSQYRTPPSISNSWICAWSTVSKVHYPCIPGAKTNFLQFSTMITIQLNEWKSRAIFKLNETLHIYVWSGYVIFLIFVIIILIRSYCTSLPLELG